jgi:hypothetical protein
VTDPKQDQNQHDMHSAAVHAQLQIYQGIVGRMASNSAQSKTWSITIVAALLVLLADRGNVEFAAVAIVPIMLFFFLDSYYLHLERCFIGSYNKFLKHVREGTATDEELFKIAPPTGLGTMCTGVGKSCLSVSVWPFYTTLLILCVAAAAHIMANPEKEKAREKSPPVAEITTTTTTTTTIAPLKIESTSEPATFPNLPTGKPVSATSPATQITK